MINQQSLFSGIISGERRRDHGEVAERAGRIAGGLQELGVRQGDSVCMLMRNDIAFIEAAYAAMRLGAYGVPINWHFKPEEINYVLKDSGTSVLIAPCRHVACGCAKRFLPALPSSASRRRRKYVQPTGSIPIISPRPILRSISNPGSISSRCYEGPARPQPQNMIYTSGTTGNPKGVRRDAPTPEQMASAERMRALIYGLRPGARALLPGPLYHSAPNSFGLRCRPSRRRAGADAAVRSRGVSSADRGGTDRHHLHGADHVHPADEAAGSRFAANTTCPRCGM